jgi:hypothetical protein
MQQIIVSLKNDNVMEALFHGKRGRKNPRSSPVNKSDCLAAKSCRHRSVVDPMVVDICRRIDIQTVILAHNGSEKR